MISQEVVEQIVSDTLGTRPADGSTHWSTRTMAARFGVGKDTVARIWKARGLQPWKIETFKLSNDPRFEEKLVEGGFVHEPAGTGGGVVRGRKVPDSGFGTLPEVIAVETGSGGDHDP